MKPVVLLLFLIPALSLAQQKSYDFIKLDSFFDILEANEKFMGTVAVEIGGEDIYSRAIGCMDCENEKLNKKETIYRIGSISKVFTATMIFQEIDKGNLFLEQTIDKWFPSVPNSNVITVDQLLNHHSGIYNFTNAPEYISYMTKPKSRDEIVDIISGYDSSFKPGAMGDYSNSNYVLLGIILEEINNKDYAVLLEENIVKPLGLNNTYFGKPAVPSDHEAFSYAYQMNSWIKQPETDMSVPLGAGAIVSTAIDLNSFIRGLFKGQLVSDNSLAKMKDMEDNYGRGLFLFPFYDHTAYGHNGSIDGFNSNACYFETEDIGISMLSNGVNYDMNLMAIAILSQVFDRDYDLPNFNFEEVELSEEQLKRFEGEYSTSLAPMKMKMFVSEGELMAQATGQMPFPLTPISENSFQFEAAGITIEFEAVEDGKSNYIKFIIIQAGQKVPFERSEK